MSRFRQSALAACAGLGLAALFLIPCLGPGSRPRGAAPGPEGHAKACPGCRGPSAEPCTKPSGVIYARCLASGPVLPRLARSRKLSGLPADFPSVQMKLGSRLPHHRAGSASIFHPHSAGMSMARGIATATGSRAPVARIGAFLIIAETTRDRALQVIASLHETTKRLVRSSRGCRSGKRTGAFGPSPRRRSSRRERPQAKPRQSKLSWQELGSWVSLLKGSMLARAYGLCISRSADAKLVESLETSRVRIEVTRGRSHLERIVVPGFGS